MKNTGIIKAIAVTIAVMLLVIGGGISLAGNDNGQGVPSAKCSSSWAGVEYAAANEKWLNANGLSSIIKTSEKTDLIISLTAECALATDVKIKGSGKDETSTSFAQIKIKVLVDGVEAMPGEVVFAYRKMELKGLLWAPDDFDGIDPDGLLELPEQYIEIYEETRTANAFNFIAKNVGSGVHNIEVQVMTDASADFEGARIGAVLGKRTLVVEAVQMVHD
jgi:hypothetical protein